MELRTGRARSPQRVRGRPSGLDVDWLRRLVKQRPDIVLRELQQVLLDAGT